MQPTPRIVPLQQSQEENPLSQPTPAGRIGIACGKCGEVIYHIPTASEYDREEMLRLSEAHKEHCKAA